MKLSCRIILCIVLLGTIQRCSAVLFGRSFLSPRSQSVDAARDLVGWQDFINLYQPDRSAYQATAITPMYASMFHSEKTAEYFFGTNTLLFSGSAYPVRGSDDILADYFGLPTDFHSRVVFEPSVHTTSVDLAWYYGLDAYLQGAYLRVHAPVVRTTWAMDLCEQIESSGTNPYPAGYMASTVVNRSQMNASVREALSGSKSVGDIEAIRYGLVTGAHTRVGLSDIQLVAGYNHVLGGLHHFGLNMRLSIPTGSHAQGHYFFEPIVGNGGHWELGLGLTGHGILYENCEGDGRFGLYADANFTHLFSSHQRRSFDLDGSGTLSRYILLERMAEADPGLTLSTAGIPAEKQYQGQLVPAINATTLCADIAVALQIDCALKAACWYKNLSIDIGYNGWARTKEYITDRQQFPSGTFAVKGDALVYGFDQVTNAFIAINGTESRATMQGGQGLGNSTLENINVNNPQPAFFDGNELFSSTAALESVRGSAPALLLHTCDINDYSGLAPATLTHRFFVHLSYEWPAATCCTPYIGGGASVEMDGSDKKTRSALSQWAVWLKAGFAC